MKKIGILFGVENSFPGALVEHINARNIEGIQAEFVETGAVYLDGGAELLGDCGPYLARHTFLSRVSETCGAERRDHHQ